MEQANVLPTAIVPYDVKKLTITNGTATTVQLDARTKLVEIISTTDTLYVKYGTGATASDFHEYVSSGLVRHYIVPQGITQFSVIGATTSSTVIIIQK